MMPFQLIVKTPRNSTHFWYQVLPLQISSLLNIAGDQSDIAWNCIFDMAHVGLGLVWINSPLFLV